MTKLSENNNLLLAVDQSKNRQELVGFCIIPNILLDTELLLKMNFDHEI